YNENAMFVGTDDKIPLMYPAEEIISVRSYDLKTEYTEGVDYTYDKVTNRLTRTANSRMPYVPFDWYYPTDAVLAQLGITGAALPVAYGSVGGTIAYFDTNNADPAKKRILYSEHYFNGGDSWQMGGTKQIAITYRHAGNNYIRIPEIDNTEFASQLNKIKNKSQIKICFFGDSVTFGCNSGTILGWEPYSEPWAKMVFDTLSDHYGIASKSNYKNLAVGGWTSADGVSKTVDGESSSRLQQAVAYNPDIFFLAYGLNDTTWDAATHITNLDTIATTILNANPNCIVCLVGSYLPHPEVVWVNQKQLTFQRQYPSLAASLERRFGHHVFFSNVMPEHESILERKRYYDGTSNNVNHPNDFICRLYAQTILYTLCGDYSADLY
ncbi:MAG: SGNH/GDSL hydrolase family protein, partial [Clostridia bacterium]|nr:SGNH/GDSL hydrolase family protein [Clostridia bacterium]